MSTLLWQGIIFGPIHSRRLGTSLGVNLLPSTGKFCNFDCIYCECGWNADGRTNETLPKAADVRSALEDKLSKVLIEDVPVDNITFSGDGEPTLNPDFPQIIEDTIKLRDIYIPYACVSVLSNATRLSDPAVFEALRKVDKPILKIDAPTNELCGRINRPYKSYDVEEVIENLMKFNGDFILQTMFLSSSDFDSSSSEVLDGWMKIVRKLNPREVMVYTVDRPSPMSGLERFTESKLLALTAPLRAEGYNISVYGPKTL